MAKTGRAIAVDLSDSALPHDQGVKPHMTVVFNPSRFTQEDIDQLQALEQQFRKAQGLGPNDLYTYVLEPWGPSSDKIIGQLYDLCIYLRENFKGNATEERIPHVALRKSQRRR